MARGTSKKIAKDIAEKTLEIDPERKFMCFHDNWREKLKEIENECTSDEETLITCQYRDWLSQLLGGSYGEEMYEMMQSAIERSDNPFEAFHHVVEMGITPPPTLIHLIDELYRSYLLSFGHYTWEEICFGKPIKGVGTYAARAFHSKNEKEKNFHGWVNKHRERGDKRSLTALAEAFFENRREMARKSSLFGKIDKFDPESESPEILDIDSFLRKYRRWKEANADM